MTLAVEEAGQAGLMVTEKGDAFSNLLPSVVLAERGAGMDSLSTGPCCLPVGIGCFSLSLSGRKAGGFKMPGTEAIVP